MHDFFFLAAMLAQTGLVYGTQPSNTNDGRIYLWIAIAVALLALGFAFVLARGVIASDAGSAEMQAISNAIRGA